MRRASTLAAVIELATRGKSNKLIAYELGIAPSTVATHIASAKRKLGVRTRVELIALGCHAAEPVAFAELTLAEQAVISLALAGLTNAEIAQKRKRSQRTIANQLASSYRKLGINSRTELASAAAGCRAPQRTEPAIASRG